MINDTFPTIRMTLPALIAHLQAFLSSLSEKSKETRGTYERSLKEFIQFFALDRKFFFRVRDVERYKEHLVKRKNMQEVSVATYMTALRRFCQHLVDTGILEKNPAKRVQGGRRPTAHTRTFLTLAEIEQLLSSIELTTPVALRDRALIQTMLGCACSELELSNANVGDLYQQGRSWRLNVLGKGKSIKDETIPVPLETVRVIQEYLQIRLVNGQVPEPDAPMFLSYSNRSREARMTIRGVREAIVQRLQASGIKKGRDRKLTPFSLRHTAGILLVESGATPEELMLRMRIEWRPTAMLYFQQKGKLHSEHSKAAGALIDLGQSS